jgi:hypothetical protein
MFILVIPLPICLIIGNNRSIKDFNMTSDASLILNIFFGIAYILYPFNWIYTYMMNNAIEEKNSK